MGNGEFVSNTLLKEIVDAETTASSTLRRQYNLLVCMY